MNLLTHTSTRTATYTPIYVQGNNMDGLDLEAVLIQQRSLCGMPPIELHVL